MRSSGLLLAATAIAGACANPFGAPPDPTAEQIVEALFLGTGEIGRRSCPLVGAGTWIAWPRDHRITLILGASVPTDHRATIAAAVEELNAALVDGLVIRTIGNAPDLDPRPMDGQITLADLPGLAFAQVCPPTALGCALAEATGDTLTAVRLIFRAGTDPSTRIHELGHGIGLCHTDPDRLPQSIMADPPAPDRRVAFSTTELDAIRRVYQSNLQPGATAAEFSAAGLIPPAR